MKRRVVITSMGFISSLGNKSTEVVNRIRNNTVNFEVPDFDKECITIPIKNFDLKQSIGRFKDARYFSRGVSFAVASAATAVKNSGLSNKELEITGLFVGSGPNLDIGDVFSDISNGNLDNKELQALWILKFLPNTAASSIAKICGIHGENLTISNACSSSLQAIGEAYRKIKEGYLNTAFAGGGDSRINPGGLLAYKKAGALMLNTPEAEKKYAPFSKDRSGFIPGEGGAFFLLEEYEHAKKRKAKILGEIVGYGNTIDRYKMTAPNPDGLYAEQALDLAITDSEIFPEHIDLVSTHGTGTILNDQMEAELIARLLGKPLVTALKSWVGHLSAACGAMEIALTLSCLQENLIPKIRNLSESINKDVINNKFLNQNKKIEFVLFENFGFGGQNSALIIDSSVNK